MQNNFDKVVEFHKAFGHPVAEKPGLDTYDTQRLRVNLIDEEVTELDMALMRNDLVGVADALGDILYVTYGAAAVFGIPINEVFSAIHRANMSKLDADGKPIYREDGKILKPNGWVGPEEQIKEILND